MKFWFLLEVQGITTVLSLILLQWSLPGVKAASIKPIPVKSVGVIGGGTMGCGIVVALLTSNYKVVLLEVKKEVL